ncbi:MAG: ERCC4 domain-containing protein [Candidatus Thorarchaeota archaeon]
MNSVKHLMSMLDKNNITYTVEKIPIGDVLGLNGIAIERKTVSDLVNTLKGSASGVPRLSKQMDALMEYEKPYLLIENILAYMFRSQLSELRGRDISLQWNERVTSTQVHWTHLSRAFVKRE